MKLIFNKEQEIEFTGRVSDLLLKLKINPETVIIAKNKELVTLNEKINNEDEIRIIKVISGG